MSKYDALWSYVKEQNEKKLLVTFSQIEKICGAPVDHSFLTYKKELLPCGYEVRKISMKNQTVEIHKI